MQPSGCRVLAPVLLTEVFMGPSASLYSRSGVRVGCRAPSWLWISCDDWVWSNHWWTVVLLLPLMVFSLSESVWIDGSWWNFLPSLVLAVLGSIWIHLYRTALGRVSTGPLWIEPKRSHPWRPLKSSILFETVYVFPESRCLSGSLRRLYT